VSWNLCRHVREEGWSSKISRPTYIALGICIMHHLYYVLLRAYNTL
jgi:hypothetical protein